MKILNSGVYIYGKSKVNSKMHVLIEGSNTAQLLRNMEIWLRNNIDTTIKISEKERIFRCHERTPDAFIINMAIIITKIVSYVTRPVQRR